MDYQERQDIKTIYYGLIESVELGNLTVAQAHAFLYQLVMDNHLDNHLSSIICQFDDDLKHTIHKDY